MSRARLITAILLIAAIAAPYFVSEFWLQLGILAMAAALASIGLTILVGIAGQISLAHAAFVGFGAYAYVTLAAAPGDSEQLSLGLPTWLAAILAVLATGIAGMLFSPLAARVNGLYLAVVSISVVFIWQHLLLTVDDLTGGFSGRSVPEFSLLGIDFGSGSTWQIGQVPFGLFEKLWLLALVVLIIGYAIARNICRNRPGLALAMMRENEIGAASMGIDTGRARVAAFVVAAVYAGAAGVLMALATQYLTPQAFNFQLSTDYLVIIIIGGLGSIRGAIAGAVFVTAVPRLLSQYADRLPFLSASGSGGIDGNVMGVFLYCTCLIAVIMFARGGLGQLLDLVFGSKRASLRRTDVKPTSQPSPAT